MIQLNLIDVSEGIQKPLFGYEFEILPRIGEWINLDQQAFEVIKIIHPAGCKEDGIVLYIKNLGKYIDLIDNFTKN